MPDGTMLPCTKDLVLSTVCTATARIALEAGQYVIAKRDCLPLYRACINDQWTAVIETIFETCRNQWSYLVPEDSAQRHHLRALCERELAFENDFLARYRAYLLRELQHPDDAVKLRVVTRLGHLRYRDDTVIAALEALTSSSADLQHAAAQTLSVYR